MINDYIRRVQYHETDRMGITHHSNYVKWMEEACTDFLDGIGYSYARLEKEGVISPVVALECKYKTPTTFGDHVRIHAEVAEYTGVRLVVRYTATNVIGGALVFSGKTTHCFVTPTGRPIVLKKNFPDFDKLLRGLVVSE